MTTERPVTHLSADESYDFLTAQYIGRFAVALAGRQEIVPVNFAAHRDDSGEVTIYIHTDGGNKLFSAAAGKAVALEADWVHPETATSVVVQGQARIVKTREERDLVAELDVDPWVATTRAAIIAIDVEQISGRTFVFGLEPETLTPEVPG